MIVSYKLLYNEITAAQFNETTVNIPIIKIIISSSNRSRPHLSLSVEFGKYLSPGHTSVADASMNTEYKHYCYYCSGS